MLFVNNVLYFESNNTKKKIRQKRKLTVRPQVDFLVETVYFTQNLCGHGEVLQETQLCNGPNRETRFCFNLH